jgi:hypothetical protein
MEWCRGTTVDLPCTMNVWKTVQVAQKDTPRTFCSRISLWNFAVLYFRWNSDKPKKFSRYFGALTSCWNSQDILTKEEKIMEYSIQIVESSLFFVLIIVGIVFALCI